ncbi:MAG TPA: ABC transporter permease [Clostridia bacterium]|nr:ABC transporter permease [Clostridia bacterium]
MQVFKVYFKILKSNLPVMMIYVGIFIALAIGLSSFGGSNSALNFTPTKTNIAFINNDHPSPLTNSLKSYLSRNANIVPLTDDTQDLQDALFYNRVDYIVRIPKGFTQNFLSGKNDIRLEKTSIPNSVSSVNMDFLVNRYLNTASLFEKSLPGVSQTQLATDISGNLKTAADVHLTSFGSPAEKSGFIYYFTYFAYVIAAVLILGVSSIMTVFNESDLKSRNLCSPVKAVHINMQLLLGNLTFSFVTWALFMGLSVLIYRESLPNRHFILLCLNSLVLMLAWLSISFLVGNLIRSRSAQSAAANVLALGSSFIGGVFVPQALLGKTVQTIASFTPTYWYIKALNDINSLVVGSAANLMPIFYCMLIQLGFAVAIVAVSLVIGKQRKTSY